MCVCGLQRAVLVVLPAATSQVLAVTSPIASASVSITTDHTVTVAVTFVPLTAHHQAHELHLAIVKKSVCIRIGPRCRSPCVPLVMSDCSELC